MDLIFALIVVLVVVIILVMIVRAIPMPPDIATVCYLLIGLFVLFSLYRFLSGGLPLGPFPRLH